MKRNFLYLAVLTLLALALLWLFANKEDKSGKSSVDALLLPEISAQINDVNQVEVISAGNTTVATLVKTDTGWQFEQMGGYAANWAKLQNLLAGLAQARVVEAKTDKTEYYTRLGVEDISGADASGVLVKVSIAEKSTGILIGHQAANRSGQYVRLQGAAASVLVDRVLEVSTEPLDWSESTIIDISTAEVAEVEIIHPQGETLRISKVSADQTDFDFAGLPQDREIKSNREVNSLASVFSMLNMETVQKADTVDWSDAVKLRMLVFSGMKITTDMITREDKYLLRLRASQPKSDLLDEQPGPGDDSPGDDSIQLQDTEGQDTESQDTVSQDIEKRALADVEKTVDNINQKVDGWAYGIAKYKYDALVKKPEDVLKPHEP